MSLERKAFEAWFETTKTYNMLFDYITTHEPLAKRVFEKRGRRYTNEAVQLSWDAWQAGQQRDGFKFVPVELSYHDSYKIALKHWDSYMKSHEVDYQGRSATHDSLEKAKVVWCENKAREMISEYKAMIGAV